MGRSASSVWGSEFDPQTRPGYDPRGPLAEFRDWITDELYWEACVVVLPAKDDIVGYGVGADGALTSYEVKSVAWEFRKLGALCYSKPVVKVNAP